MPVGTFCGLFGAARTARRLNGYSLLTIHYSLSVFALALDLDSKVCSYPAAPSIPRQGLTFPTNSPYICLSLPKER